MLTQVIIISLTFFKQNSALRDRWRAPVLSIMIRDGSAVFIVISSEESLLPLGVGGALTHKAVVLVINMIYKVFRREVASVVFS